MLEAQDVTKTFKQGSSEIRAVREAGLCVEEGERIYIHGRSGAGKSTLLHLLGGLRRPSAGTVSFLGKNVYKCSDRKRSMIRNRHFGFIFQLYHLLPELSVMENVMLPARIKGGLSGRKLKNRAIRLLKTVGMEERLSHKPAAISGGEAQRTAIARALINGPDILFCDEPTGNLDSEMSDRIYTLIKEISETQKMSVVVVSHQEVKKDFFHREYIMDDGRISAVNAGPA
ncbi:MAG: ATP-binding cassette domain-containing protein [Candidatus Omnitrophica bacterium]|nr:ATP-binding cassette domain-containing protein [Candidatus Omnitrophota bacterium]